MTKTQADIAQPVAAQPSRSIIYIDGFNLYYGAIRGTQHKWLDLQSFFTRLRPADSIFKIRYFTALVRGSGRPRQETYLRALATLPLVEVILGNYKYKNVKCGVTACGDQCDKWFQVPEEKRTDVNIAVRMLDDAYQNRCDRLILITGDSDLVPAANQVKVVFPEKEIIVYVPTRHPTRGAAYELRGCADKHRDLPLNLIKVSQFPATLPDGQGGTINKPQGW